jgi:nucleoid-associated protein YgaU
MSPIFETAAEEDAYYHQMEANKNAGTTPPPAKSAEDLAKEEKMLQDIQEANKARVAPKIIAKHKLTAEETLSHLSLKYYGHATRDYWMVIYEANKEEIGDNPAHVRVGMEILIPELPDNLKAKK